MYCGPSCRMFGWAMAHLAHPIAPPMLEPPCSLLYNVHAVTFTVFARADIFCFLDDMCRGRIDTPSLCSRAHDMALYDQAASLENSLL